jgi:hypothetical protein
LKELKSVLPELPSFFYQENKFKFFAEVQHMHYHMNVLFSDILDLPVLKLNTRIPL